ncbi:MAG: hypothetical protein LBT62_07420 [Deltaproteobacteria bacterium]|jgi:hypothetical protein|nr:hypothetical protein [Deltaproteobacteria bacterium]
MFKQIMDVSFLSQFVANKLGTSKVLVKEHNDILTIEPFPSEKPESAGQEVGVDLSLNSDGIDETKAGALSPDDFKEMQISTIGFKFDKEEANERR